MRRREVITLLGGAAMWPLAARAQQAKIPVIGFLSSRGARDSANVLGDFHRGLTETGVVLGQNAEIIYSLRATMIVCPRSLPTLSVAKWPS